MYLCGYMAMTVYKYVCMYAHLFFQFHLTPETFATNQQCSVFSWAWITSQLFLGLEGGWLLVGHTPCWDGGAHWGSAVRGEAMRGWLASPTPNWCVLAGGKVKNGMSLFQFVFLLSLVKLSILLMLRTSWVSFSLALCPVRFVDFCFWVFRISYILELLFLHNLHVV